MIDPQLISSMLTGPALHAERPDEPARGDRGRTGRVRLQAVVERSESAEQRIRGDVPGDAVLTLDVADPIASRVPKKSLHWAFTVPDDELTARPPSLNAMIVFRMRMEFPEELRSPHSLRDLPQPILGERAVQEVNRPPTRTRFLRRESHGSRSSRTPCPERTSLPKHASRFRDPHGSSRTRNR